MAREFQLTRDEDR